MPRVSSGCIRCAEAAANAAASLGDVVRKDFVLLDQNVHDDKPLIYLDSGATSQKPASVIAAMRQHEERDNANVHRGAHSLSARSTEAYEAARAKLARFVNAKDDREIVFTRGATEAINLVAQTWGREHLQAGDEIVLTVMEHHSNLVPWQMLAKELGVKIRYAKLRADETLDMDQLTSLVVPGKTKLIACVHVSNMLGCVNPVEEIGAIARAAGAKFLVDACQSVPHMPVDVQALGCDFLVASGHKMCGPTGIGFLWGSYETLDSVSAQSRDPLERRAPASFLFPHSAGADVSHVCSLDAADVPVARGRRDDRSSELGIGVLRASAGAL